MAFFQLNDVFGYQHANDMKRLWAADTAPADPGDGEVWLDISASPFKLKRYNGTDWDVIAGAPASELLESLKTVDGTGSGLDADKLDGKESVEFLQRNSDGSLMDISGTDLDDLDGSGIYRGDNLTNNPDDSVTDWWVILHTRYSSLFQNQIAWNIQHLEKAAMYMRVMGGGTWGNWFKIWTQYSDGAGSGLDADKVDGLEASAFVRNDAVTDINAHTEWQDTYQARFGNDADLRIHHDGGSSYIGNYTGELYIRQLNHGSNIKLQAEDASGTMKTLLVADPDTDRVTTRLDRASLPDLWRDTTTDETQSPHIQTGQMNGTGDEENTEQTIVFDNPFTATPRMAAQCVVLPNGTLIEDVTTTSFTLNSKYSYHYYDWWAIGKKV